MMLARHRAVAAGAARLRGCPGTPAAARPGRRCGKPVRFKEGSRPPSPSEEEEEPPSPKPAAAPPASAPAAPPPQVAPDSQERVAQRSVRGAVRKVRARAAEVLATSAQQAQAYSYLGTLSAACASLLLVAPLPATHMFLNGAAGAGAGSALAAAAGGAGAALVTTAAVFFTLREAAARSQLALPTFRRLNAALKLAALLGMTVAAQGVSVRTPQLAAVCAALFLGSFITASRAGWLATSHLTPSIRGTGAALLALAAPRNGAAAAYSALTVALGAGAAALWRVSPGDLAPLAGGALLDAPSVFLCRSAAAGLVLAAVVAYSLKDGADRGKLGVACFRWLNLGLLGSLMAAASTVASVRTAAATAGAPGAAALPGVAQVIVVVLLAAGAGTLARLRLLHPGGGGDGSRQALDV